MKAISIYQNEKIVVKLMIYPLGDFDIQWKKNEKGQTFKVMQTFSRDQDNLARRTFLCLVDELLSRQVNDSVNEALPVYLAYERREHPEKYDGLPF